MTDTPIRNAATIIAIRDPATAPKVLMGQRGAAAVFMPDKFVFPGGAVDPDDAAVTLASPLPLPCAAALSAETDAALVPALAAAAIRELWEEAGLALGLPGDWPDAPPDWRAFAALGLRPHAAPLRFVFRAVTPPGRPRRFDARFFLTDAAALAGDLDDFSRATDELSALQWIPLDEVRHYPLPFVTEVVLAEVAAALPSLAPPPSVPFFRNGAEESLFLRLKGVRPPEPPAAG
jgi:8-oxo-dGTP pyrophosphatase MutT (NUDIX family)